MSVVRWSIQVSSDSELAYKNVPENIMKVVQFSPTIMKK
jgi:hypothetical protein